MAFCEIKSGKLENLYTFEFSSGDETHGSLFIEHLNFLTLISPSASVQKLNRSNGAVEVIVNIR